MEGNRRLAEEELSSGINAELRGAFYVGGVGGVGEGEEDSEKKSFAAELIRKY